MPKAVPEDCTVIALGSDESSESRIDAVVVGQLIEVDDAGQARVRFSTAAGERSLSARTTISLRPSHKGRAVTLVFEQGDPLKPIVTGLIQDPGQTAPDQSQTLDLAGAGPLELTVDGERVVFDAQQEIVLRCGKASIVLTAEGRVIIRGTNLLSRASGTNKIKGSSVRIN